jgi:hypothetical protein
VGAGEDRFLRESEWTMKTLSCVVQSSLTLVAFTFCTLAQSPNITGTISTVAGTPSGANGLSAVSQFIGGPIAICSDGVGGFYVPPHMTESFGSPNGQKWEGLSRIPGLNSLPTTFQGVLRVSSPSPISVVGMREHGNERNESLLTIIPPVNEATPPAAPLFFPHIVDSGGYTTQFIVFSAQPGSPSSGTMQLFNQSGGALGLILE